MYFNEISHHIYVSEYRGRSALFFKHSFNVPMNLTNYNFTLFLTAICSERVGQMTKTFNDIEAVTRLLEEKERDLELAARIGQTLLDRNKSLSEKNDQLEAEVSECHDKVCVLWLVILFVWGLMSFQRLRSYLDGACL